jgi:PAS domain S-box-containing protein
MVDRVQDYAIFLLDPHGHIQSWNAGAARIKQYSAQEIIGQHFSIFYPRADVERGWPAQELQRAMTDGRFEDEGWRVRKDGSRFWANVVITALRDDAGVLLGFSKITRDLSERRAAEERLRQSEERFRLLVDGVEDYAICMLDPDGTVTSWNSGARRISGYEAEEIIGHHFSRFHTEEDIRAGAPWAELAMARQHGHAQSEGWRVRKNGTRFWARAAMTALPGPEGRPHGFAMVTQDMTVHRQRETLQATAAQLNSFLAIIAHELRNPLAPIRSAVEVLRRGDFPEGVRKVHDIIDRQSAQLSRLVDDLLDVGRVTRGNLTMDKKPLSVESFVHRAIETARPAIEAAGHLLDIHLPQHPLMIEGDEARLTQALANILNNAARYTDPGGRITVRVGSWTAPGGNTGEVAISVADTGRGIAPDFLDAIFGMFVQGKELVHRPVAGLGVGLSLARSIAELHHGTVEVHSAGLGEGSEFILRLPLMSQPDRAAATQGTQYLPPAAGAAPSPLGSADRRDPRRLRVLVVDDNVDAADSMAELVASDGHEAYQAHGGYEALEAFEQLHPEVVLLDIGMPDMSGLEVARRLRMRAADPRPRLIAVTGWGKPEDRARSREAGFDRHLVKPVEADQLREALAS